MHDAIPYLGPSQFIQFTDALKDVVTLAVRDFRKVSASHRRRRNRDARPDIEAECQRRLTAAILDINHAEPVSHAKGNHAMRKIGQFLHVGTRKLTDIQLGQHGTAQRQRRRSQPIFADALNIVQIT